MKRRPYIKGLVPKGRWRSWAMYGEGCLGDWSCHLIGPVATALDLDMPTAVTMDDERGFDPKKTPFSFPHAAHYKFEFPAKGKRGPLIYHWYECMRRAPRPAAYEPELPFDTVKSRWCGGYLVCEKETLMFGTTGRSTRATRTTGPSSSRPCSRSAPRTRLSRWAASSRSWASWA